MTGLLQPGAIARREWLRIVLGASVAAGGWKAARAEEPAVVVNIDNFTFSPAAVTVKPGTVVTWTNRDDIPHVVVMQALKLRSKVLDTAESFTHRFERPGSFDYFCALHPYMKGKVIVVA
jgi:plastocyanin